MYSLAHAMLSGSVVMLPAERSTRRTLRCQPMSAHSRQRHRRVAPHPVEAAPIGVAVHDGVRGADFRALRITPAQVALVDLAGVRVEIDGTEGAGGDAGPAAHAGAGRHLLGAGQLAEADGVHRAGVHAPRLVTLGAGIRDVAQAVLELEDADARARRVELPGVLEGTRHLALQATGALVGIDMK